MSETLALCSNCEASVKKDAAFCTNCGIPLDRTVEIKSLPASPLGKHRSGTASWNDLRRLWIFYGLLLACSFVFGIVNKFNSGPRLNVAFDLTWIAMVIGFLIIEWPKVSRAFRWRTPKSQTLLEMASVCMATVGILKLYFLAFSYFNWPLVRLSSNFTKAHWPVWSIFLMLSFEPGIFEEIAFRGILQTRLSGILSAKEALIIQAALFSVLHLSPAIFVSHFVMGLLLGWVRFRTGHIYFGVVLHTAWNAVVVAQELSLF